MIFKLGVRLTLIGIAGFALIFIPPLEPILGGPAALAFFVGLVLMVAGMLS